MSTDYVTPNEVAARVGVHPSTVRRWREEGVGPKYYRLPRGWHRYPRAEFEAWLAENLAVSN